MTKLNPTEIVVVHRVNEDTCTVEDNQGNLKKVDIRNICFIHPVLMGITPETLTDENGKEIAQRLKEINE